jgi:hypothetical protein
VGGVLLIAAFITGATVLALSSAAGDAPAATQAVLGVAAGPSGRAATRLSTSSPTSRAVTVSSEIAPDAGSTVFTDDFHDSKSGWATTTSTSIDSGMTFSFSASGYVIGSTGGEIEHHVLSPYRDARRQLSMALTATQIDGPVGLGFGVSCRRGQGAAQLTYSFLVQNDGAYSVERIDGDRSDSPIKVLRAGVAPIEAGPSPITVVGMCASFEEGETTRLVFFAEGQKLIDLTDTSAQSDSGWLGALVMVSGKGPSVMTAKHWQERDLSA